MLLRPLDDEAHRLVPVASRASSPSRAGPAAGSAGPARCSPPSRTGPWAQPPPVHPIVRPPADADDPAVLHADVQTAAVRAEHARRLHPVDTCFSATSGSSSVSTRTGHSSPGANGVRAPQISAIRPSTVRVRTAYGYLVLRKPKPVVSRSPDFLSHERFSRSLKNGARGACADRQTSEIRSTFRGTRAELIRLPRAAASVSPRCRGLTSIRFGLRRPSRCSSVGAAQADRPSTRPKTACRHVACTNALRFLRRAGTPVAPRCGWKRSTK